MDIKTIDVSKTYTCNGKRVVNIQIILKNSSGSIVSYPVKGSIVVREKPLKLKYAIWSIEGKADVVWGLGHNLIEVP